MKYELPENHGLSAAIIENLVFKDGAKPALSDIQHEALRLGTGRGESALVVSPTSTGKTQIAVWAIAQAIEAKRSVVYLVTHRALAKQKFEAFRSLLLPLFLADDGASLVSATGDSVENANGDIPADPLHAPVLVATYEKYLGLLSASGVPADMKSIVFICDEVQLIGDASRGQNVEVLLTLIKSAGWHQFLALSAVLDARACRELANWLDVNPIVVHTREKHLRYECWAKSGIASVTSDNPEKIDESQPLPKAAALDPVKIVASLLKQKDPPVPIIVFCTRKKQDTFDLAERYLGDIGKPMNKQLTLAFEDLPATSANTFLGHALANRVGVHSTDLTDEERELVEQRVASGALDVIFATSTLAAGVNFPFGAAVFANFDRWEPSRREYVPIDAAEFHNMAGRVGRMGYSHAKGRVIFIASTDKDARTARDYLRLDSMPALIPRISPARFDLLCLQLVASSLCTQASQLENLICGTFSALREQDSNAKAFATWPGHIQKAVALLVSSGFIIRTSTGKVTATAVGKAVGFSGLLPQTGAFLLAYLSKKASTLASLLPSGNGKGDVSQLAFLVFSMCFSSPEFRVSDGVQPTRFLPWQLDKAVVWDPTPYQDHLVEPIWQADIAPINAASLTQRWIEGTDIEELEKSLPQLSAGALREMFRNLSWVLQGAANICAAAANSLVPAAARPPMLNSGNVSFEDLQKLPRVIRRLCFRVAEGLSDDVLWLTNLDSDGTGFRLFRQEILKLRALGLSSPEQVMLGSVEADRVRTKVFERAKPAPQAKANWLRDAARAWKADQRRRARDFHLKRALHCSERSLIEEFYDNRGEPFEATLEKIFAYLKIPFRRLDDKTKSGAPDYLLTFDDQLHVILEVKTREAEGLVDYNRAVEVLAASEIHALGTVFCVTLCNPGVDPSVPLIIAACGRLSVVENRDLGEALLRLCEGNLKQDQFWRWLCTPGQALAVDLPYRT